MNSLSELVKKKNTTKKKRNSGTEENIIFAGADPSVDQGTEKISLFPLRLQRDSSSYLALLLVL